MKFSDPHPGVEGAGRRDGIPEGRAETDLTDGNVGGRHNASGLFKLKIRGLSLLCYLILVWLGKALLSSEPWFTHP